MKISIARTIFGVFIIFCSWLFWQTLERPDYMGEPLHLINTLPPITDAEKASELAWKKYSTTKKTYDLKVTIAQAFGFLGLFIAAISAISLIYKYVAVAYTKRTHVNKKLKDRELHDKGILAKEEFEKKLAEEKKDII
ncbi:hypothetical protein OAB56_02075 [Gammaproteobacteria bacterium]|jgi:hypothetical protein|nr:hypothetical protein [Gammaproteobacteria bacterium]|tara:strand:+ start:1202 stop:1615 length:414 start_codon:yes stop_codon:yes gene_type:complete